MELVHSGVPDVFEAMDHDDPDYRTADARLPRHAPANPDLEEAMNTIVRLNGAPTRIGRLTRRQLRPAFAVLIDRIANVIDAHLAGPGRDLSAADAALVNLEAASAHLPPNIGPSLVAWLFIIGLIRRLHPDLAKDAQEAMIAEARAELARATSS